MYSFMHEKRQKIESSKLYFDKFNNTINCSHMGVISIFYTDPMLFLSPKSQVTKI